MHISIISPYSHGPIRGNLTTVRRIAAALNAVGTTTGILPLDTLTAAEIFSRLAANPPDLILAFHAGICGETACRLAEQLDIPCIITTTGGDINDPLFSRLPQAIYAMNTARKVVCFDEAAVCKVLEAFPNCANRITVIPQGVERIPLTGYRDVRIPDDAFVILLPAALRPVKNIEFPLQALVSLAERTPHLRLVIAGGIIDQVYAGRIKTQLASAPFAIWLGEVPHERMGDLYSRANLVLNCSHNEGMPNSLLEAMALDRPVIAAQIPGNRSLVRDRATGWLYSDAHGLVELVEMSMNNTELCAATGQRAGAFVRAQFSPQAEAQRYCNLFSEVRARGPK